ncbi:MAG: hypothetical protein JW760_00520 [Spirochaetales bacterium]|nr:hypothetical protein [Spirochaetales bacterium]
MTALKAFNEREQEIIDTFLNVFKKRRPENTKTIMDNVDLLTGLSKTINRYPSMLGTETLGKNTRTIETLIDSVLSLDLSDHALYIPTKAVLGRSFISAKINFLYLLKYLSFSSIRLKRLVPALHREITKCIFTLMSEEVFLSIVSAEEISKAIREKAAMLLINIWEYRLDRDITEYAPLLTSLWFARKKLSPVYGSLMGLTELHQMAREIDSVWFLFLKEKESRKDIFEALEEFLFNLTFEEIRQLRLYMQNQNLQLLNRKKVESVLGKKHFYPDLHSADPREMYRFFEQRKINAEQRRLTESPGPHRTIETFLLLYLLEQE